MIKQNNKITTKIKNTKWIFFTILRYRKSHKHSTNNINFPKSNQHQKSKLKHTIFTYILKNKASTNIILTRRNHSNNQNNLLQPMNPDQFRSSQLNSINFNKSTKFHSKFSTTKKKNATHYKCASLTDLKSLKIIIFFYIYM
jgi:hypothetical protein